MMKCKIESQRRVVPCSDLERAVEVPGSKARGLHMIEVSSQVGTVTVNRRFVIARSGDFRTEGGGLVEYCPFCGTRIGSAYRGGLAG